MRIVSWNCGGWSCGGFNVEKFNKMKQLNPDILLIQECTKKEFDLVCDSDERKTASFDLGMCEDCNNSHENHWYGDNEEKSDRGLAIFSISQKDILKYDIELVDNFNSKYRFVVPYKTSHEIDLLFGIKREYFLFHVWTKQPSDGSWDYQKTIINALNYYNFDAPIILAGDFNTGSNKENMCRYEKLKTKLEKCGLKNCAENTEYEYEPTFYHDKTKNYYTNDFCFIPRNLNVYEYRVDRMNNQKRWKGLSDHCPIIADFGELTVEEKKEIEKQVSKYSTFV